jgi:hypothetical protein
MRRFFRSLLALFAIGTPLAGCNKSADPNPAKPPPPGGASGSSITLYVPGIT